MNEIEQAIAILDDGGWWKWIDISSESQEGRELLDALTVAIAALRAQQERLGKAWVMYENEGAICPNCIEHVCKGWNFCPECGELLAEPKPLSLDELRERNWKPIWIEKQREWFFVYLAHPDFGDCAITRSGTYLPIDLAAKRLAYDREPRREEAE